MATAHHLSEMPTNKPVLPDMQRDQLDAGLQRGF